MEGSSQGLPWSKKERGANSGPSNAANYSTNREMNGESLLNSTADDIKPGEFVLRNLFAEFALLAEKKIDVVLSSEPLEKPLSKSLQRGEDAVFDQLLCAFGSVAEHCLPSLLRTLFAWYERQLAATACLAEEKRLLKANAPDSQSKATGRIAIGGVGGGGGGGGGGSGGVAGDAGEKGEQMYLLEKRDLAVEFIFCLVLVEVLKQLSLHPGHEDLTCHIENLAFKQFKFREGAQTDPNLQNMNIIADLYAEVVGVLVQSRFQSVRKRFMTELKELRCREPSPVVTHGIVSLLMGMKFFRIKMVPIEEFEASFQFMHESATYFLEVKDRDIKHALAGLFVEILVPVAAIVKNEVNVPCLKNFVELLYSPTQDLCTKKKHMLALFPLLTCLLCVSQKTFFLHNWYCFLHMCLQHLKNRDPKMSRVALESLYRLLWVYMIRIKCESNTQTQTRLQSIVNSLFPKGSKAVVPRDTPLNIFVKIIQFIAQERLDFAMKEIVFDLLSVGRPIKIILTPERMSIGLRAFLVVADSLQQKEGEPPMPRTVGVLPSGNTMRVKKTFLNKMLTEEMARSIGVNHYHPYVKKALNDILRALDVQFGRPLMIVQNINKEPDDMITGERKPKIDLFRTCVAAIPRLIPDGMSRQDLVDLLSRLTVHMDEEMRALAFQSLQNMVNDFADWREDVVEGFMHFMLQEINDTFPQLLDNALRMLLQFLSSWKNALQSLKSAHKEVPLDSVNIKLDHTCLVLHRVEGLCLVMLCSCRQPSRRLAAHILKETRFLLQTLIPAKGADESVVDVMDRICPSVVESCIAYIPANERSVLTASSFNVDLQWLADRNGSAWIWGPHETESGNSKGIMTGQPQDPHWEEPKLNAWLACLMGFMSEVGKRCPSATHYAWALVCQRLNALFTHLEANTVNDNRASVLLRSASSVIKKTPNEKDVYLTLWKSYLMFSCKIAPTSYFQSYGYKGYCFEMSPSPDSLVGSERTPETRSPLNRGVSPLSVFKQIVPLIRSEQADLRGAAVLGLSFVNPLAMRDLMEELVPYIREAIDRKQENMRRRKRRELLRIQLGRLLELMAEKGTFGSSQAALDRDAGSLNSTFVEYVDGIRLYLESESDKDVSSPVHEIKQNFCNFVNKLIKSFGVENRANLFSRDLRRNLFQLFGSWSGRYGTNLFVNKRPQHPAAPEEKESAVTSFEFSSLQAMSTVLCCGPMFDPQCLTEDNNPIYAWILNMLSSDEERIRELGHETVVLLLEHNSDSGPLLDWLVDCCYTRCVEIADSCFVALATIFCLREYPCDHYIAIINVTVMNVGCPRSSIHQLALQLLQVLDYRFFNSKTNDVLHLNTGASEETDSLFMSEVAEEAEEPEPVIRKIQLRKKKGRDRGYPRAFEPLLSGIFPCSQLQLSRRMAQLHPHLTMPIFSEITYRFQSARPSVSQNLLEYLVPWLFNMELVDPHVAPQTNPLSYTVNHGMVGEELTKEGWGSAEATEMVLNNLFYISVKFGDDYPKEIEEVWASLCSCWPNNLRIIVRYLFIVTGLAPNELLPFSKKVVVFMARSKSERFIDEIMTELQSVESLNCLIERTETPPFFRITSIRKGSGHSEEECSAGVTSNTEGGQPTVISLEQGTLHTKRHSTESGVPGECVSQSGSSITSGTSRSDKLASLLDDQRVGSALSSTFDESILSNRVVETDALKPVTPQPHPLPMPEFGGFYAPLTEFLPSSSQPVVGFHRCNLALMLVCDVVVDGAYIDWTPHIPIMLHIIFLGLDHPRQLVHEHCKQLLLNLLIVCAQHKDSVNVARIMLRNRTIQLGYGLTTQSLPKPLPNFTEPPNAIKSLPLSSNGSSRQSSLGRNKSTNLFPVTLSSANKEIMNVKVYEENNVQEETGTEGITETKATLSMEMLIKYLIDFLSSQKGVPLWNCEDITAKVWTVRSSEQLAFFLEHILHVFKESFPTGHVEERWAEVSLQLALSCSSRHYAGRSLQIFRALKMPVNSRMLSDILSRLVETVAEQGEDMQGYVTELMLTLEAAVDSLDSEQRIISDFIKEFFKSTPNLNSKEGGLRKSAPPVAISNGTPSGDPSSPVGSLPTSAMMSARYSGSNHTRSTSYSVSFPGRRFIPDSPISEGRELRNRSNTDTDMRVNFQPNLHNSNLGRSRSAQSLKIAEDQYLTPEDRTSLLSQFFWIAVAMLETDYEHEFLLALRLLDKTLSKLPLERSECQEKVEKILLQTKWPNFPGIHALLLKGCTSCATFEPTMMLLHRLTPILEIPIIDPSESANSFPFNVMALLPYMLVNYDEPNSLCIHAAENFAQWCTEKSKKLDNLATVMTLYSRQSFSKQNFQWTKCVVKYLYDAYSHAFPCVVTFLVEVMDKGPSYTTSHVMSILHCILHYMDINASTPAINSDLNKVISKYIEGSQWKDALKIIKLIVTRSSTLAAAPAVQSSMGFSSSGFSSMTSASFGGSIAADCISIASGASFADSEFSVKRELPGRTMEFTFDLTQTPIVGRKYLIKSQNQISNQTNKDVAESTRNASGDQSGFSLKMNEKGEQTSSSPRRSLSYTHSFNEGNGSNWRRPWLSQSRTRERLIGLLTSCGQRVGLPKSPSVIFSQSSDILDRQSSLASSTEELSATNNDASADSKLEDNAHGEQFGLFKDFDFLEYELESQEGESMDNFNWGVRRRSLSNLSDTPDELKVCSPSQGLSAAAPRKDDLSSDEEGGSVSPLYEGTNDVPLPPSSIFLSNSADPERNRPSSVLSRSSSHSMVSDGDLTLSNTSLSVSPHVINSLILNDFEDQWNAHIPLLMGDMNGLVAAETHLLLNRVFREMLKRITQLTRESCQVLPVTEQYRAVTSLFLNILDIGSQIELPFIYVDAQVFLSNAHLLERHKFGSLEIQEHWETFVEKKEHLLEILDSIRSATKLESLGENLHFDRRLEQQRVDLCKCLYKAHFQLLLLIESYAKLVSVLSCASSSPQTTNLSGEVTVVKTELVKAVEETESDRHSPTIAPQAEAAGGIDLLSERSESEATLKELVASRQWSQAIKHLHYMRTRFPGYLMLGSNEEDDMEVVLTLFCGHVCRDNRCNLIITQPEHRLTDVCRLLMDTGLQLSSTLHSLEHCSSRSGGSLAARTESPN